MGPNTEITSILSALGNSVFIALMGSYFIQKICIKASYHFQILDFPTARRRHDRPVPVLGGVGIFGALTLGLAAAALQQPAWFYANIQSFAVLGSAIAMLVAIGLVDDLRGLNPYTKLIAQAGAAVLVLAFEPQAHFLVSHWQGEMGLIVWPLALLWIITISNAMNLIDGLDGLAGGMSLLVASSVLIIGIWSSHETALPVVLMGLLIPSIAGFLFFNWSPAKIFMGDNGSLPLGFLLATSTLISRPPTKSWIMIASMALMLGYPLLDMALVVFRRGRHHRRIFLSDRTHLHHRFTRLGLNVPQTTLVLLGIGFYLQASALAVNLMTPGSAVFGIAIVTSSIAVLLALVRYIELARLRKIFARVTRPPVGKHLVPVADGHREVQIAQLQIDLEPLLDTGGAEEGHRFVRILTSLELMLTAHLRGGDTLAIHDRKIFVALPGVRYDSQEHRAIRDRFQQRVDEFVRLYNLQPSLSGVPVATIRAAVKPGLRLAADKGVA